MTKRKQGAEVLAKGENLVRATRVSCEAPWSSMARKDAADRIRRIRSVILGKYTTGAWSEKENPQEKVSERKRTERKTPLQTHKITIHKRETNEKMIDYEKAFGV